MPSKTFYVTLQRSWQSRNKRWSTRLGVTEDRIESWFWKDRSEVLAVIRLDSTSKDEAIGIAAEFMLKGFPSYMDAELLYKAS